MTISLGNTGTGVQTNGSNPAPGLPANLAAGDLMLCAVYTRETVDGTISISSGWTQISNERTSGGCLGVWWRAWQSGDVAPTITLGNHTTGTSGDSAAAQICRIPGCDINNPIGTVGSVSTNAGSLNIGPISGISIDANNAVIVLGGKQDDWTSVATLSGDGLTWTEIGEPDGTQGLDCGMVWDIGVAGGSGVTVTNKSFVVTGGTSVPGKGIMFELNAQGAITRTTAFSAVGTMATAATKFKTVNTAFSSAATMSSVAAIIKIGSSLFSATASMASAATAIRNRSSLFSASGTMASVASQVRNRATAFNAAGTLATIASHIIPRSSLFSAVGALVSVAAKTLSRAMLSSATGSMSSTATLVGGAIQRSTSFSAEGALSTIASIIGVPMQHNRVLSFAAVGSMSSRATLREGMVYNYALGRGLWNDYGRRASQIRYRGGRF